MGVKKCDKCENTILERPSDDVLLQKGSSANDANTIIISMYDTLHNLCYNMMDKLGQYK